MDFSMGDKDNSTRKQFEQEAEALKQIIYEFIDGGHIIMAAQLLEQYALLNPDDPDLDDLRGMLYPEGVEDTAEDIPEEYKILNNIETVFILSGVIQRRIGFSDSVLRKIKLMEEKWNYKPLLLTCIHNIDQRKTKKWLETAGVGQVTLSPETRILNVYEHFQKSYAEGLENKAIFIDDEKEPDNSGISGIIEVEDSDEVEGKKQYDGYMASLRTVRYFKNGNAYKDVVYDDWGYLNYIREYSEISEDIYDVKYYTTDGKVCIEALFRPTDKGIEHEKIFLYDDNEEIIAECANSAELAAICLDRIMQDDKFYMLIVEDGLMSKTAAELNSNRKNAAKCIVVHSIFLVDAYDPKSEPQAFYKYLCANHDSFNGIIMLTKDAANDFKEIYGSEESLFVSPHPYPFAINKTDFDSRDNLKAVIISRLDQIKRINYAIEIFALVVEKVPDARLEIYGRGAEEENLKKLIKKLGLENNVILMGYTDDPLAILNTAVLFMMTSVAEGFGLTIMESICNGCPSFAFDIKYGPSEIIDDGRTGYLIPRFNKEIFAKKIIDYFNDVDLQRTMSENCYEAAPAFSTDRFMENWFKMTETLYNRFKAIP